MKGHVLISVPGGALDRRWDGSIVPNELVGELIRDITVTETINTLNLQLAALGIGTKIIARPEIFSSGPARAYLSDKVPDLCGHIFIGPPHQLKYLKNYRNLACFTPVTSPVEADLILREFTYNPMRLRKVHAGINGFPVAALLRDRAIINNPMLLPKKTIFSQATANMGEQPTFKDLPVASLFLNNHDSNNSARIMMSRLRPLTHQLASRPGILQSSPVFLATIEPHRDLPTGLAPTLRDFAYLALTGMEFAVIVLVEGVASLSMETLEGVAERLNKSLKLAGFHPGFLESEAIIIAPALQQMAGLLRLSSYLLLFDFDWPESGINQLAIRSGIKPVLLSNAHPTLRNLFLNTALVIPAETDHTRRTAGVGLPFDYPAAGSLQKIVAKSLAQRLPVPSRTANIKHAANVFEDVTSLMNDAFERKWTHEINFG